MDVFGRNEEKPIYVCTFKAGDHVGELEFLNKHLCVADVVANGEVRAAKIHRDHFEKCMVCYFFAHGCLLFGFRAP